MKVFFALLCIGTSLFASAQNDVQVTSAYDPHSLFSPMFYPVGESNTRAATGEPNLNYWQNRADYKVNASLNEITHEISGTVIITYKNNSPLALPFLWLQLDQNLFKKDSRGQLHKLDEISPLHRRQRRVFGPG